MSSSFIVAVTDNSTGEPNTSLWGPFDRNQANTISSELVQLFNNTNDADFDVNVETLSMPELVYGHSYAGWIKEALA